MDTHLGSQGKQAAGRGESPEAILLTPQTVPTPPLQPGGWLWEHGEMPLKSRDPCEWETPANPRPQAPAAACPSLPCQHSGRLVSQWGGGTWEARALLHSCAREETPSLPTFPSVSHLLLELRQDTAQAQQTWRSSRADFKQERCLKTPRAVSAANKNTHLHATRRFKSCL